MMTSQARPAPDPDDIGAFLWEAAARGELRIQRCSGCGLLRHPPSLVCSSCHRTGWDTVALSGRGVVYSYVLPRRPAIPFLDDDTVLVLIDLAEGVRFISNLVDVSDPGCVSIGAEVEVDFLPTEGGYGLPVFRLAPGAA